MRALRQLTIRKYRDVPPDTVLRFSPGVNVLLGRNGTGKTTLLDLIAVVLSGDFRRLEAPEWSLDYEVETEDTVCRVGANGKQTSILGVAGDIMEYEFRVVVERGGHVLVGTVTGSMASASLDGADAVEQPVRMPGSLLQLTLMLDFVGRLDSASFPPLLDLSAARFDEALGFYDLLCALTLTGSDALLEGLPTLARHASTLGGEPRQIDLPAAEVPFATRAAEAFGWKSAGVALSLVERKGQESTWGRPLIGFDLPNGDYVTQGELSWGQKRLLAWFWYLARSRGTVVADELVNGLHHDWIDACIDAIGTSQAFLTSQNPLLLDFLTFDSAEEVAERFIQCRMDDTGRRQWSNLSPEDAEGFLAAYQVGIQHVGEILRTRGLW